MGPPRFNAESAETLPKSFRIFWLGQGLSAIGDAMTVVALPLVVLAETGSVTQMGRLTAFARTGALLATAGAGFVVDSWRPRRVMMACDAARWVLLALLPLAAPLGFHRLWLLYLVAMGAAFAQGIFYVGHVSLVAELVGRARVNLANSRIEGTIALAYVFGPALAGVLSARFGATSVLGFDSATFLASLLSLYLMTRASVAPSVESEAAREPAPPLTRSWGLAGLRFIRGQPELLRLTVFVALYQLFTAAMVDLFIFRLKHDLDRGDTATGLTFAVASATAVVAAALTPWLRRRFSFHGIWATAVVLQGLALGAACAARSLPPIAGAAALYMASMTTMVICQASLRQELIPQHLLGRVTSSFLVLVSLPMPVGALAATALAARFGAERVQGGSGAALLATAALASVVWARMPKAADP